MVLKGVVRFACSRYYHKSASATLNTASVISLADMLFVNYLHLSIRKLSSLEAE